VDETDQPSIGAGEVAAGPLAAAIANAVTHALGVRPRHLPLTPDRLLQLIHSQN
jgi:CO/xanthine dehydrogenase Mo-binding subunit